MDVLEDFAFRGLIYQVTDEKGLAGRLRAGPTVFYNGYDPTADSLTIGNLVTILIMRRLQVAGHHPIAVVGGGTGLIGDPSGKSAERQLNPQDVVEEWTQKIRSQLARFLDFEVRSNPARVVNNYQWLSELDLIGFMRDYGKYFPVNYMLAKESVSSRLDVGISFTEFSYMVLQAYDFLWLRLNMGCELQTGGSDQWGNITAGADLIRRVAGHSVFGLTCPLVTTSDGSKIGKTALGAVWLDPDKTSPYQFFQYFVNTPDQDVAKFLRIFTFLPPAEIRELEVEAADRPSEREAQRTLAREATAIVHGRDVAIRAEKISRALFYGNLRELSAADLKEGLHDVPTYTIEGRQSVTLVDLLAEAGIAPSKRRAREDVQNGAITINGERCTDLERVLVPADRLEGSYLVIRRGKSSYHLIRWLL